MNTFLFSENIKLEICTELSLLCYLLSKVYIYIYIVSASRDLHTQPFVTHLVQKVQCFHSSSMQYKLLKIHFCFFKNHQISSTITMNHLMISWIWFAFLQVCELQMFLIIFLLHFGVLFIQDGLSFAQ